MKMNTKYLTKVAILSAIATVIMFLEWPLPFMPPFLKFDFSDIPALIGSFALGPVAGVLIELVKNLIHVTMTQTGGVGELANFITGVSLVLPAGIIYKNNKNFVGAITAIVVGALTMSIASYFVNYYITIPFFTKVYSLDAIIAMCNSVNSSIKDMKSLIVIGVLPFNIIKAFIVGLITVLVYKRISPILHR